jgi:DNA-binding Lrp family transcriptional regulator
MVAPRASFRQLAAVLDVSGQTIARRYRRLTETASLRVYGLIGGPRAGWADWLVRLQAAPGSAQRIADTLAQRPDTRWVRLYSGGTEIVCTLQACSPEQRNALFLHGLPGSRHVTAITALYAYLTTRLADLPGLQSVETAPIIGTVKRVGQVPGMP